MSAPFGIGKPQRRVATALVDTVLVLTAHGSARAQVVPDLLGRVLTLEDGATKTTAALGTLGTGLGDLRKDVTTLDGAVSKNAADLTKLTDQFGDLRRLLDGIDVPDVIDVAGPADLSELIGTLNRQSIATAANASNIAKVDIAVNNVQNNDNRQDVRLDDHERRITETTTIVNAHGLELVDHERRIARNTDDIRRHDLAIAELQSQMASNFADMDSEIHRQGRRIDKATEGVAMALAMKSPTVPEDKEFAVSGSFGAFEGQTALAVAGGIRATEALQFDAGVAVGLEEGSVGGRAGATLAW